MKRLYNEDSKMISVLQYGFGSVGRWTTEIILRRENLQLMGVIDTDPSLQGKDPGTLLGIGDTGLRIGTRRYHSIYQCRCS